VPDKSQGNLSGAAVATGRIVLSAFPSFLLQSRGVGRLSFNCAWSRVASVLAST